MTPRAAPALLALLMSILGCGRPVFPTPPSPAPENLHAPTPLEVGVARADITPPPGVSLFGHGPEGRVSNGYWTRLYCRAFVFFPKDASPLAVVPCDLPAMSTLLQRTVAKKLSEKGVPILATRLMMTATHTHAGPGHYFEGTFYGDVLSTRAPGFDPNMVEFLAERIACAIADAANHASPARLAWGHTALWGVTHNRSYAPFLQNDPPYSPDPICLAAGAMPANLSPEQRAIDPCLDVLQIDGLDATGAVAGPLGVLAFFAMHPTVLPNTNRLLGADVDGVISRDVERALREDWARRAPTGAARDPLAGIVNTNEGDVSPVWTEGTPDEAIRIGARVASAIVHAPVDVAPPIVDARYVEMHLPYSWLFDGPRGKRRLCPQGLLGLSVAKGASDHPTALTLIGDFTDENVDFTRNQLCSRPRRPVLGPVQALVSAPGSFPEDVPLALAQLGDTMVSFVPAEMTVTAGAHLTAAVAAEAAGYALGVRRSLVAGLANGYIQYVTTEREYDLQHYEGGSNLYGRWTEDWLVERYAQLARAMAGVDVRTWLPDVDRIHASPYSLATQQSRLALPDATARPARRPVSMCRMPGSSVTVCFRWHDGAPGDAFPVSTPRQPWVRLVRAAGPKTTVTFPGDPRDAVDDTGVWFRTRVHEQENDGYSWTTVLTMSPAEWSTTMGAGAQGRITVGDVVVSEAFSDAGGPPACTAEQFVFCNAER